MIWGEKYKAVGLNHWLPKTDLIPLCRDFDYTGYPLLL